MFLHVYTDVISPAAYVAVIVVAAASVVRLELSLPVCAFGEASPGLRNVVLKEDEKQNLLQGFLQSFLQGPRICSVLALNSSHLSSSHPLNSTYTSAPPPKLKPIPIPIP